MMQHIKSILFVIAVFSTAINANAATGEAYNFLPLAILFAANLLIGGLLFVATILFFNVWRDKRLVHQRATARLPGKSNRRQHVELLTQNATRH